MAVRQVEYRGMTIKAAAFEVMGTGRFVVTVSIARTRVRSTDHKVFEPPSDDGFFDDPDEGLDIAIAFGRDIIDGSVPDLTVDDL